MTFRKKSPLFKAVTLKCIDLESVKLKQIVCGDIFTYSNSFHELFINYSWHLKVTPQKCEIFPREKHLYVPLKYKQTHTTLYDEPISLEQLQPQLANRSTI